MNEKIKDLKNLALVVFIAFLCYGTVSYVNSYSKSIQPTSFRNFSVSAEGKSVSIPDVAEFSFSVITEGGKNVADLQKTNTEKVNKAIEFAKSNDVDKKDIKTESYNVSPRYQYYECKTNGVCPPSEITGYTITQSVGVKVRNFDKIGDLLAGVVKNGANTVSELSFKLDDPTQAEDAAREEAIEKAQKKAEQIASAGGFSLGKLLSIEEGVSSPVYPMYGVGGGRAESSKMMLDSAVPAPAIEAGSKETTVTVTLKYEID
ncbi:MAG: hypothetical protein US89_C0002G0002 [Candidatus Peregrinibacteria bacterium GW2011_GWF2_38_29]|nr:MAG: hypothetical protein US89_C0002G0002 [Candidatus Peregrinibacteria bacterium GW2011_GWF2_38_29]HBB03190.1 hypothetical protein [Candidatus Peregrinibacteria bacterium]